MINPNGVTLKFIPETLPDGSRRTRWQIISPSPDKEECETFVVSQGVHTDPEYAQLVAQHYFNSYLDSLYFPPLPACVGEGWGVRRGGG